MVKISDSSFSEQNKDKKDNDENFEISQQDDNIKNDKPKDTGKSLAKIGYYNIYPSEIKDVEKTKIGNTEGYKFKAKIFENEENKTSSGELELFLSTEHIKKISESSKNDITDFFEKRITNPHHMEAKKEGNMFIGLRKHYLVSGLYSADEKNVDVMDMEKNKYGTLKHAKEFRRRYEDKFTWLEQTNNEQDPVNWLPYETKFSIQDGKYVETNKPMKIFHPQILKITNFGTTFLKKQNKKDITTSKVEESLSTIGAHTVDFLMNVNKNWTDKQEKNLDDKAKKNKDKQENEDKGKKNDDPNENGNFSSQGKFAGLHLARDFINIENVSGTINWNVGAQDNIKKSTVEQTIGKEDGKNSTINTSGDEKNETNTKTINSTNKTNTSSKKRYINDILGIFAPYNKQKETIKSNIKNNVFHSAITPEHLINTFFREHWYSGVEKYRNISGTSRMKEQLGFIEIKDSNINVHKPLSKRTYLNNHLKNFYEYWKKNDPTTSDIFIAHGMKMLEKIKSIEDVDEILNFIDETDDKSITELYFSKLHEYQKSIGKYATFLDNNKSMVLLAGVPIMEAFDPSHNQPYQLKISKNNLFSKNKETGEIYSYKGKINFNEIEINEDNHIVTSISKLLTHQNRMNTGDAYEEKLLENSFVKYGLEMEKKYKETIRKLADKKHPNKNLAKASKPLFLSYISQLGGPIIQIGASPDIVKLNKKTNIPEIIYDIKSTEKDENALKYLDKVSKKYSVGTYSKMIKENGETVIFDEPINLTNIGIAQIKSKYANKKEKPFINLFHTEREYHDQKWRKG